MRNPNTRGLWLKATVNSWLLATQALILVKWRRGNGGEGAGVEGSTRALVADPNPPGLPICGFLAAQHLFPFLSVTGYQNH